MILVASLPRLDDVADSELSVVLDVAQVNGEILAAGLAVRVALVADRNGLAGDAIAADGKVAWEDLECVSCVYDVLISQDLHHYPRWFRRGTAGLR